MSYQTTSRLLGDAPTEFFTTSTLCIISNKATADEAILSRSLVLHFAPTNLEVHKQVAKWFWRQEIHDWFGQHLADLRPVEARWYVAAFADMEAGRNWRRIVRKIHGLGEMAMLVKEIEVDPQYRTRTAKIERFLEQAKGMRGASRASYMRLLARLKKNGQLRNKITAPVPLRYHQPPVKLSQMEADALWQPGDPEAEAEAANQEASAVLDVPSDVRETFTRPIGNRPAEQNIRLSDRLPGESEDSADDDGEA
jgi:hypothetical protein